MRKWISSFTLIEMLVVIAIIAILAGLLLPALARAREESRRKSCDSNLGQIVKACTTYQEPNGDFFPAFEQSIYWDPPWGPINTDCGLPNMVALAFWSPMSVQGADGSFQPMPSLAVLYPAYIDNVKVFGCPSTSDKPQIAFRYYNGHRHTSFGWTPDPGETGTITGGGGPFIPGVLINGNPVPYNIDPAVFVGNEVTGNTKCSYFYDERTNFRDIGPGQAIAADADGYTWLGINGKHPPYYSPGLVGANNEGNNTIIGWARPTIPNHDNGQNVMYFDGHVKWSDNSYASRDPNDNIYEPQAGWGMDTDAYVWDGTIGDSSQPQ